MYTAASKDGDQERLWGIGRRTVGKGKSIALHALETLLEYTRYAKPDRQLTGQNGYRS